jgi:3-phosphoshikimate 1-carboxyvinyltransferase
MRVRGGPLTPIAWELEVASAQLKSAIMLAGLCGGVAVRVREPAPTRDHTEQMLRALGVDVGLDDGWIAFRPVASLPPATWEVPGDPSSAAFFLGLAALADRGELAVDHVLASPYRDGFVRVLQRMGVAVSSFDTAEGSAGRTQGLTVQAGAALRAVTVGPDEVPSMIDELPLLAVLAARAEGETTVRGAAELRVKESDRIAVTVANLRAIGADAEELPDGFVVRGGDGPLRGVIETHGDHRIAMAFGVLGASRGAEIRIDNPDCVAVSYPGFWSDLERVTHG